MVARMTEPTGPDILRSLAARIQRSGEPGLIRELHELADQWESERIQHQKIAAGLEALRKMKVDLLERDRKWWQDNAIGRRKKSVARKSGDLRSGSQRPAAPIGSS
jgi:hypothetical protein